MNLLVRDLRMVVDLRGDTDEFRPQRVDGADPHVNAGVLGRGVGEQLQRLVLLRGPAPGLGRLDKAREGPRPLVAQVGGRLA